jgi:oxazoline/thiazoline dehydrogenase
MIEAPPQATRFDARAAANLLRVSLPDGVAVREDAGGGLALVSPTGAVTLDRLSPGLRVALDALGRGGSTVDGLADLVLDADGPAPLTRLYYWVNLLASKGLVQHTAVADEMPLATIRGIGPGYRFAIRNLAPERPLRLSRFAYCRRAGDRMVLETPRGHALIVLHDPRAAALVALLARPTSPRDATRQLPGLGDDAVAGLLQLLLNAEALSSRAGEETDEEDDPALAQWGFHDLLFHARSRYGRHAEPYGANFRHLGRFAPLPATKPVPADAATIELPRPDLARLAETDPPLTRVIEGRRSVYRYGERPITLAQLGEFLFRVARVRDVFDFEIRDGAGQFRGTMPVSSRPYPGGGRCYELEFYPSVDRCEGLDSGLYHYDPLEHRLRLVRPRDWFVEEMLRYASIASPGTKPQVLITLAARFARVSWKYDAMAYAATLKHVGIVYQTMYLVATAMGLAPSALGSGNADLFAAAAGTDYFAETSVGEFMLGSRE